MLWLKIQLLFILKTLLIWIIQKLILGQILNYISKLIKKKLDKVIQLVDGYETNNPKVWYTSAIAVAYNSNPFDVIYVENTTRGHFIQFVPDATGLIDSHFVPEAVTESTESPREQLKNNVLGSPELIPERSLWHPRGGAFNKIAHILKERGLVPCSSKCKDNEE